MTARRPLPRAFPRRPRSALTVLGGGAATVVLLNATVAVSAPWPPVAQVPFSKLDVLALLQSCNPSLLLSRALSFGVIAGSLVGKLPQVHSIIDARSAKGISVLSIWTELVSMGIQCSYNVVRETPLSTYAEVPILFLQIMLLALVAAWADGYLNLRVCIASLGVLGATVAMALRIIPVAVTLSLYTANAAFGFVIILPQVAMNFRSRSTGQLSFMVTAMTFCGLTSRLFTTLVEVEDTMLRLTVVLNWLLTAMLMCQFWAYRSTDHPEEADEEVFQGEHIIPLKREVASHRPVRRRSFVDCISQVGSSRCLTDLLGDQGLDHMTSGMTKVQTWSTLSKGAFANSFPSFSQLRRVESF